MKKIKELKNKIKELNMKYQELKKDPKKNAGMKLLGYFIFFFVFMLIATVGNEMKKTEIREKLLTTTTTEKTDKFSEKQTKLLTEKYNIVYNIKINDKEYKIEGDIENNILSGYLEGLDNIKKISLKNNNVYEINSDVENELELDFNINYINVEYIINRIKSANVIKEENNGIKIYKYNIILDTKSIDVNVKTDEDNIVEININDNNDIYNLNFDK